MRPEIHKFQRDDVIPNNPDLPVLFYHEAVKSSDLALFFRETFENHGWGGVWENGIFDYHHFHSNAHEALGIAKGAAKVQLGGDEGSIFEVKEGDLLVLPAGTGHKRLSSSDDFLVIGAYPKGQENYDICRSRQARLDIDKCIAAVSLPEKDPLTGDRSPLLDFWA
jgi:uncharacterized protein YjlB